MFQLTDFTEARLASVTNRTEKHGDEDVPAVTLSTVITAANTLLDSIEPGLRHALYKPSMARQLPGVEPSTPVLRANCIDTVVLTTMHEGWRLLVDDGIDDTDPMTFDGVKVDKLRVDAKQGGSIELTMRLGTSNIDADRLGKLGMHNGKSIWVKLLKPEVKPDASTAASSPSSATTRSSATARTLQTCLRPARLSMPSSQTLASMDKMKATRTSSPTTKARSRTSKTASTAR
jgi:hypothetical protein